MTRDDLLAESSMIDPQNAVMRLEEIQAILSASPVGPTHDQARTTLFLIRQVAFRDEQRDKP